jgi:hypothetical protein
VRPRCQGAASTRPTVDLSSTTACRSDNKQPVPQRSWERAEPVRSAAGHVSRESGGGDLPACAGGDLSDREPAGLGACVPEPDATRVGRRPALPGAAGRDQFVLRDERVAAARHLRPDHLWHLASGRARRRRHRDRGRGLEAAQRGQPKGSRRGAVGREDRLSRAWHSIH